MNDSVSCFLDTNVLVYAVSSSPAESAKKERALELIEHVDFGLSAQVFIALGLGLAAGVFFGEGMTVVAPLGDLFIALLQMVIPCS